MCSQLILFPWPLMAQGPLAYLQGTQFSNIFKVLFSFPDHLLSSWGWIFSFFTVLDNQLFSYTSPQRQSDKWQSCATPLMKCHSVPAYVACVFIEVVKLIGVTYFNDGEWMKEKWKGFFLNCSIYTWRFMPVTKEVFLFPIWRLKSIPKNWSGLREKK